MPEEKPSDDVEKVLADLKGVEDLKQTLIADLLRQKAEAVKAFDDKLAKLGYQAKDGAGTSKKSHHKQPKSAQSPATKTQSPPSAPIPASPKTKRKS